jgi:hypothetical protein
MVGDWGKKLIFVFELAGMTETMGQKNRKMKNRKKIKKSKK